MEPSVAHAPATIICTGTYWRNAWKYQARTYRHFGWCFRGNGHGFVLKAVCRQHRLLMILPR
jgi:hypothetical protein